MTAQSAFAIDDEVSVEPFGSEGANFSSVPRSRRDSSSLARKVIEPMNPLSRLIHQRKDELELTWDDIADRGGFKSHTVVYALAKKAEHKQPPRAETLRRLAKALQLPLDVVRMAAAESAGFRFEEVPTTLAAAGDLRIIAAAIGTMSDADRAKLVRLAEAFAGETSRPDDST